MEIVNIFPPHIYSIQYDEFDQNEFDRLLELWNDVSFVTQFLADNAEFLHSPFWKMTLEPEAAARQVLLEAESIESLFDELSENSGKGVEPNFDTHFSFLEGKYKYETELVPMKSYGTMRPSLLRLYAIKMASNTYLITGGGIKLADSIQSSPDLKDHVLQNIDRVRDFLKSNGILDNEDL